MIFVINGWNQIYENAGSRKVERLFWIPIPNKHDSFGFRMLMDRPNGTALYGAWVLFVQVASRCDERGVLVKNGVVLTPTMIAMLTHAPESLISEMLEVVQSKGIEWVSVTETAVSQPSTSQLVADRVSDSSDVEPPRARDVLYCSCSVLSSEVQEPEIPAAPGIFPKVWEQDEQYARFVADYLGTGANLIGEDFAEAWQWTWRTLDFEQKLLRVAALAKHSEEYRSDPRFVPKPQKFLKTEWKRDPKPLSRGPGKGKIPEAQPFPIDPSKIIPYDPFGLAKKALA